MAKRKTYRRKKPGFKIPLFAVAGFVPGAANLKRAYDDKIHGQTSGLANIGTEAGRIYLGFDNRIGANPKWNLAWLWEGSFPIVLGFVASKVASRLGANRMLARTGLPIKL